MKKNLFYLIFPFIFTSCAAVGPNYQPPQTQVAPNWNNVSGNIAPSLIDENTQWWKNFNDEKLNSLIERAAKSNLDLKLAEGRIREARALRDIAISDESPDVTAKTGYTRTRRSQNSTVIVGGGSSAAGLSNALTTNLFQAGFDATWELDIFGGVRRSIEAAQADLDSAYEARRFAVITLLGEVAGNYVQLRGAQAQLSIINKNIKIQEDTLGLNRVRFNAGLTNGLDVIRSEAQVYATKSQIPPQEQTIKQAIHRLSVLLGQEPSSLAAELDKDAPIPSLPAKIIVAAPADLLRRRPDIRKAERDVASACAKVGVAYADLYPRFVLNGSIGVSSIKFSNWISAQSRNWSFGPNVTLPVFDGGRIRQNIKIQDARQEQALVTYEQTVLTALEDVENALSNYAQEQIRLEVLRKTAAADRTVMDMAKELYLKGLTDFFDVLDAERSLNSSENELIKSQAAVTSYSVAIYKALGGGWGALEPSK